MEEVSLECESNQLKLGTRRAVGRSGWEIYWRKAGQKALLLLFGLKKTTTEGSKQAAAY